MTTGFIYAALFYIASLICAAVGAYFVAQGNWVRWFEIVQVSARMVGPLFGAVGFVIGFFREKRKQAAEYREEMVRRAEAARQAANRQHKAATGRTQPQTLHSSIFQPLAPTTPGPEHPPGEYSDEVREFLKQTSKIDSSGIREFVEQTRRYKLADLHDQAKQDEKKEG